MTIWKQTATCEQLNTLSQKSAVSHLGIEFTAIGEDWIEAQLQVDEHSTAVWRIARRCIGSTRGNYCQCRGVNGV